MSNIRMMASPIVRKLCNSVLVVQAFELLTRGNPTRVGTAISKNPKCGSHLI